MPILYELEPNTATVAHPNHEDVKVDLVQPDLVDILEFQDKSKGNRTPAEKFMGMLAFLAQHTKLVQGLVNREGAPVKLAAPIDAQALVPFTRTAFDCEYEDDIPVLDAEGKSTGQTERKMVKGWFANYLVTRLMEADTFDRPLEQGKTPSMSNSTGS